MMPSQIDLPEKTTETWTFVRLCSTFNEGQRVTCDLPAGHEGPHRSTILWNGEDEDDA
jgi:hypothetical protein